jgi:hypothetical protein
LHLHPRSFRPLVLITLIVSLGCDRGPASEPASPPAAAPAAPVEGSPPPPAAPSPEAVSTPGGEGDEAGAGAPAPDVLEPPPPMPFGVPECDTFVTKFLACVEARVPADQQPRLMADLQENRTKWRQLATMSQAQVALSLACRTMAQSVKGDLIVDYGCEF